MKTPIKYTKMVNNGYITKNVLGEVLYSINKRAKNYRDMKKSINFQIIIIINMISTIIMKKQKIKKKNFIV